MFYCSVTNPTQPKLVRDLYIHKRTVVVDTAYIITIEKQRYSYNTDF